MSKDRDFAINIMHRYIKENSENKIIIYKRSEDEKGNVRRKMFTGQKFDTFDNAIKYVLDYYKINYSFESREISNIDHGFRVKIFNELVSTTNNKVVCGDFEVVEK